LIDRVDMFAGTLRELGRLDLLEKYGHAAEQLSD
jgi:hypothetical protein